ncbi:MAG: ArsA family ATPase [Actinobacteria bacterium]|nr:ArsA family ATPase [Actinomycetota bacterium]MDQ3533777.1 AAA family ATPase [Actinomycetota bacterium]
MNPIEDLIDHKEVIVCAGSGGVGKTTIAASIALRAALEGKKAAVLTIDPARRLATSLGLKELSNHPVKVNRRKFTAAGLEPIGELHAMMLDTKTTFDEVVLQYAPTRAQAERIIANRFYRNISSTLSGTQEYMAMEKLYELHSSGDYDVLVVDTPPTRNALDFLDSPRRLTDFFESRMLRWFLIPYMKAGGGIMRVANVAANTFLRLVKRMVGGEVLQDTAEFFGNLEGMYDGFKERAQEVAALLRSDATTFVVVTSPSDESVGEATYFGSRLNESGLPFGALVVNRVHPKLGDGIQVVKARHLRSLKEGSSDARLLAALLENEAAFMRVVGLEEDNLTALARKIPRHRWVRVPYLEREAVDFPGLVAISEQMFPSG